MVKQENKNMGKRITKIKYINKQEDTRAYLRGIETSDAPSLVCVVSNTLSTTGKFYNVN